MKQSGFSLIEILIALAVSAALSLILYRAFTQSTRLMQQVRTLVEENSDLLASYAQIEKDFSAAFIPFLEKVQKAASPTQQQQAASPVQTQSPQKAQEKEGGLVPFSTTTKDGKLATISFVTTNVISSFEGATPRLARVTYRFIPETSDENKKLMMLMREEAAYDQKAERESKKSEKKPAHAFALLHNISSYEVKFSAFAPKKDAAPELLTFASWGTDEQKKKAPDLKLPEFVELTIEVSDPLTQSISEMVYAVTIPAAQHQVACAQTAERKEKKAAPPAGQPAPGNPVPGNHVPGNPAQQKPIPALPPQGAPLNMRPPQAVPAGQGQRFGVGSGSVLGRFLNGGR